MSTNPHITPTFRRPNLHRPLHHIKVPPHIHKLLVDTVERINTRAKLKRRKINCQTVLTDLVCELLDPNSGSIDSKVRYLEPFIESWSGEWKRVYLEDSIFQDLKLEIDRLRASSNITGATQKGLFPSNVVSALLAAKLGASS